MNAFLIRIALILCLIAGVGERCHVCGEHDESAATDSVEFHLDGHDDHDSDHHGLAGHEHSFSKAVLEAAQHSNVRLDSLAAKFAAPIASTQRAFSASPTPLPPSISDTPLPFNNPVLRC